MTKLYGVFYFSFPLLPVIQDIMSLHRGPVEIPAEPDQSQRSDMSHSGLHQFGHKDDIIHMVFNYSFCV